MFLDNSYYKGILTEYIAIIYLFFHGYTILKRRYKTKFGEVDIIASKNKVIIGVEIKARFNKEPTPEFVFQKQRDRIKRTLNYFIIKNNPKYINYSVLTEIIVFKNYFSLKHYKN